MGRRKEQKRHLQMELLTKDGTRAKTKRAANKRRNRGGRPPKGERAGSPHKKRRVFKSSSPIHVSMRVESEVGNLRRDEIFEAFRGATIVASQRPDARIVHLSIQRDHVHLLVEAEHRLALARAMQAFQISAAKRINRVISVPGKPRRKGRVFSDRYHAELITNRKQAHRALGYVLNNWRKHREDEADEAARAWLLDRYSTGILFDGWKEREGLGRWTCPVGYAPLVVSEPRTWLLRVGWRMYGLISYEHVPGASVVAAR